MIRNTTKKRVIAKKAEICSSILSKAKGLMFSGKIRDKGMVFAFEREARRDLHMLFVFYPIDVIFLNKDKKVAELKENFMPFSFYFSKNRAQYIIEVEKGKIKESRTLLGDRVSF